MTDTRSHLEVVPITFRAASAFVADYHRHHRPPRGTRFCLAVVDDAGQTRGVAMVGRPIARHLDDGRTAEVNRTCTDGCANANSALYAAAWRAARALGYLRLITYTQAGESGASLRGAGWRVIGERPARNSWAASTADPRLVAMRDPVGHGSIDRTLWEAS